MLSMSEIKDLMYSPGRHQIAEYVHFVRQFVEDWGFDGPMYEPVLAAKQQLSDDYRSSVSNAVYLSVVEWLNGDSFWNVDRITALLIVFAPKLVDGYWKSLLGNLIWQEAQKRAYLNQRRGNGRSVHSHLLQFLNSIKWPIPQEFWRQELSISPEHWLLAATPMLWSHPDFALELIANHTFVNDEAEFMTEEEIILCEMAFLFEEKGGGELQKAYAEFCLKERLPKKIIDAIAGVNEYLERKRSQVG